MRTIPLSVFPEKSLEILVSESKTLKFKGEKKSNYSNCRDEKAIVFALLVP